MREAPGLYLHLPFCRRVCPYCDFAVRTGDRDRRRRFARKLAAEAELVSHDWSRGADTLYLGGGTPSLLAPEDLATILDAVRSAVVPPSGATILLEGNPEDVSPSSLRAWRELGVGTLSLGVQSLDAEALRFLGREHDPATARRAVRLALEAGFETVSVDLIYGRPGQTEEAWREELAEAVGLGVQHLSCYQLTVHPRTRFELLERRGLLTPMPAEGQGHLFRLTHRWLADAGFAGYEVSNFAAAPAHRSRHNRKYWNHVPYLGLGPSAHSFDGRRRFWNHRRTEPWEAAIAAGRAPVEGSELLAKAQLALESLMSGLRTYAGVDLARMRALWGIDLLESNRARVDRFAAEGLLTVEGDRLLPTIEGLAVADWLASRFEVPGLSPGDARAR